MEKNMQLPILWDYFQFGKCNLAQVVIDIHTEIY